MQLQNLHEMSIDINRVAVVYFFFSSRRRHTRFDCDWSSDVCSSDLPVWLAGILGAGIISAVMGSDAHQVLALSTMFTKDIYQHYGGREKYGERGAVYFARAFIVLVTIAAYLIALELKEKQGIFEIPVR